MVKMPLPADELPRNSVMPPVAPATVPALVVKVPLPALALCWNRSVPTGPRLKVAPLVVVSPLPSVPKGVAPSLSTARTPLSTVVAPV